MRVALVVAIAENNAIGKDNELLWYLPADLKHFKEITTGHTVIMGRKTFDSIRKPLPKRRNIVITRQKDLHIEGAEVVNSLEEAIALGNKQELAEGMDKNELHILGGAEIYKQAIGQADRIYLTRVHQSFEADAFFPEINETLWEETDIVHHEADEKNLIPYSYSTLVRK